MSDKMEKELDPNNSADQDTNDDTFTWTTPFASETSLDEVDIDFDHPESSPFGVESETGNVPETGTIPEMEPVAPYRSEPVMRAPYAPEPEVEPEKDSEPLQQAGGGKLSAALSIIAILISSAAMLLHFASSDTSTWEQEKALLKAAAERSEARYLEVTQELNRRVRVLESQQEHLEGSLQMQSKRIDSKFGRVISEPSPETLTKEPSPAPTTAPVTGWAVNLMSMEDKEAAAKERDRLIALEIPAEISPFYIDKTLKYRIRISGFPDKETAELYRQKLASQYGIKDGWVYKP
ncbi:Sporulation related domain-containing protein [Mariprofundus ferrinatatus]|uniref:Sporulation related domain-containing protein n=1 Tax=Mariprofundus ferrinatatus TaxID=1921087 RepID=A0A2K8L4N1_9PROT|nr:SPOR domain-containing protein [Mariprofundus ferrinatatus]ATX82278.1 Sporulation related domain-containing protein [Mariprofundus ferrinatatus]